MVLQNKAFKKGECPMFALGQKVKIKNTDMSLSGEKLGQETLSILKACNFIGEVTQKQNELFYVAFQYNDSWVTQVFKESELEAI